MVNAPEIFCIFCIALGSIVLIYRILRYPKRVKEMDSILFPLIIPGTLTDKLLYFGSAAAVVVGGISLLITELQR